MTEKKMKKKERFFRSNHHIKEHRMQLVLLLVRRGASFDNGKRSSTSMIPGFIFLTSNLADVYRVLVRPFFALVFMLVFVSPPEMWWCFHCERLVVSSCMILYTTFSWVRVYVDSCCRYIFSS